MSEASIEAKRLVSEARAEAEQRLATADAQVDERREFRDKLSSALSVVQKLMLEAAPLLQEGAEFDGVGEQPEAVPAEGTNGARPTQDRNGQEKTVPHLTPVPEQQRHSTVPPSKTKLPLKPRPTAGAGSGR